MTNPQCKIFRKSVQWESRFSLRTDGQIEIPDEADSHLLQLFCESAWKRSNQ